MDWALAAIADSDDLPCNLQAIARAIAKNCDLNYLPHLTFFGEDRALFFLEKHGKINKGHLGRLPKNWGLIYLPQQMFSDG